MATSCVTTPTLTRTDVSTSESLSTTTTQSVSTLPGSVSTTVFRTCTPTAPATACTPTPTTSFITLPGNTTTVQVLVTATVDVQVTNLVTLFGSSCSQISTSNPPTPPSSSTTSTSTTPTPTPVVSTPPPTVITSQSVVTSGGSTFTATFTSTSIVPPTTITDPLPTQTTQTDQSVTKKSNNNIGPIVGGVVGGIIAILVLGFLTWKLIKKQRGFDDFFNKDDRNDVAPYKKSPIVDKPKPQPYNYGMVGQQDTNPIGFSPPTSPPTTSATLGNDVGTYNQPAQHLRNLSLTPLLAGAAAAGTGAGAAPTPPNHSRQSSSRPSTSGSIGPLIQHAPQNMGYPPARTPTPTSYPPALQNWTQQTYGQGVGQGPQQMQGAGQQQTQGQGLAHQSSVISTATTPSMYSTNTVGPWSGAPSSGPPVASGSGSGGGMQPLIPLMAATSAAAGAGAGMGMAARRQSQQAHHPQPQQAYQQYDDPFGRTGSPVSIQEQRILQVTNATNADTSSIYGGPGPNSPLANASFVGGSSRMSHQAGTSAGMGSPPTSPGRTGGPVDGKGRPLSRLGEKPPLVHLDGGLYQEPERVLSPGPAPPAYLE